MKSTILAFAGLAVAGLLVSATNDATASTNTITPAVACMPNTPNDAKFIQFSGTGIVNADPSFATHDVHCPVVRRPVAGVTTESFYVDGCNVTTYQTVLSLYADNYDGTFQSGKFINKQGNPSASGCSSWDEYVTLPTIGQYSYVQLYANLNGGNTAQLYGVTAIE